MSGGPDIGTLLTRALEHQARHAGCPIEINGADWDRWASATFTGARHRIAISTLPCPATEAWLAGLSEADFDLRGHLVADLAVGSVRRTATNVTAELEVLTVEIR
ncbi:MULTISPECIES: hypothetical protein [unclassified Sphingomonas]|uniref:hypothetical protein n=1 Tax=unclassified Sphingomonas TaxID=196159 RepID=UPI000BCA0017|nr:MAG: hypothetical protein B7Z43_08020 [Sphingomonas sp. 12-62-6]OYX38877.1 MAG: hypothetical protein B7Y98_07095 [Sphingomonas sp. 32-62-10]OYY65235.1 MAG: hypothetical protein B7Y49_07085 [Sphingomonas sp. 28-62-11]